MRIAAIAVTLALIGPSYVWAESLGEVAAREREKKKGKPAGKVITEQDLGKRHGKGGNYNNPDEATALPPDTTEPATGETPASTAAAAAPVDPNKPKEKTTDELRADAQTDWSKRRDAKNAEITQIQSQISELEGARTYADPVAQARLQKLKDELAAAQAALNGLEVERRRNGFAGR
jgi:hypothetical protein